jgi:hypothetical protein
MRGDALGALLVTLVFETLGLRLMRIDVGPRIFFAHVAPP